MKVPKNQQTQSKLINKKIVKKTTCKIYQTNYFNLFLTLALYM
jgi:hypothetical protein